MPDYAGLLQHTRTVYLVKYAHKKKLKIKESKTEIKKFNFCTSLDFPPELIVDGFKELVKVTKETKLPGIIVTEDLGKPSKEKTGNILVFYQ